MGIPDKTVIENPKAWVAAAGVVSVGEFLLARRADHAVLLVRLTLAFVLVAFLISALRPKPLAGALATAW